MIKRIIISVFIIFCFCCTSGGYCATEKVFLSEEEVLAEAQFSDEPEDVQKARYEAFKEVVYQIDPKTFEKYLKDKNFVAPVENKYSNLALQEEMSGDLYCHPNPESKFNYIYYSKNGRLAYVRVLKDTGKNSCYLLYNTFGKLEYVVYVKYKKSKIIKGYLFDKSQQWIKGDIYQDIKTKLYIKI